MVNLSYCVVVVVNDSDAGGHLIGNDLASLHPGKETVDEMADKERFFAVLSLVLLQSCFFLEFCVFVLCFSCFSCALLL